MHKFIKPILLAAVCCGPCFCVYYYEPDVGSMLYTLGAGVSSYAGTVVDEENQLVDNYGFFFSIPTESSNDTQQVSYTYLGGTIRLKVSRFFAKHFNAGLNVGHTWTSQYGNYDIDREHLQNMWRIGANFGSWLFTFERIGLSVYSEASYLFGNLHRAPILAEYEFADDQTNWFLNDMNAAKRLRGFGADIRIRLNYFPFSGRFLVFVDGGYSFSAMRIRNDQFNQYADNHVNHELSVIVGAGYLTQ
ncbi:MAG: hypothetical protein GF410_06040 [Chitinivibrionales bacterium]|nr:hypothetical protein [Chitinivibrionales bacterium]